MIHVPIAFLGLLLALVAAAMTVLAVNQRPEHSREETQREKEGYPSPDTHPLGFTPLAFFLSMLWFRVNGVPVFPLGLLLALLLASWHRDIERALHGRDHFSVMLAFSLIGTLIGLLLH